MGVTPKGIIRWGIGALAAIVLLLLALMHFIRYPDVLSAAIEITSLNPPVYLRAPSSGRLSHILVSDQERVEAGRYLAILENTADFMQVQKLKKWLAAFHASFIEKAGLDHLPMDKMPILDAVVAFGDLQPGVEVLSKFWSESIDFTSDPYYNDRMAQMRGQLRQLEFSRKGLAAQAKIIEKETEIVRRQHDRCESMFKANLISSEDFDTAQKAFLQQSYSLEAARVAVAEADARIAQVRQSLLDLEHERRQKERQLRDSVWSACDELSSAILAWEQRVVIKAPISGRISFMRYWKENQAIQAGDNLMAVLSEEAEELIGKINLPIRGSGKIEGGQRVLVKFLDYPYEEFGSILGRVLSKSEVPDGDHFIVTVGFPDGLTTSHGKTLNFQHRMAGTAEVVTRSISLLQRLLIRGKNLLRNSG